MQLGLLAAIRSAQPLPTLGYVERHGQQSDYSPLQLQPGSLAALGKALYVTQQWKSPYA